MATNKKTSKTTPRPLRKVVKMTDLKKGDRIVFNDGWEKVSLIVGTRHWYHNDLSAFDKSGAEAILFNSDFEKGHVFYAPRGKKTSKSRRYGNK